jgi:plasmid replication initiation protein
MNQKKHESQIQKPSNFQKKINPKNNEKKQSKEDIPKDLTIHKQNSIIRGKFSTFDLHTIKCLNSIYWMIQKNYLDIKNNNNKFRMELKTLRKLMGLENINKYNEIINDSLKKLQEPFTIYNYIDSEGEHWDLKNLSLIRETGIKKGFQHEYIIEAHPDLIDVIGHKKNWTALEFSIVQKFNSKYTIRLYEYLKSYANMGKTPFMSIDDINRVFITNYKHLSKAEEVIKRCMKDLNLNDKNGFQTDITVDYEKDKKKKTIQFFIKFRGNTRKEQKEEIKINNIINSKSLKEQQMIENLLEIM